MGTAFHLFDILRAAAALRYWIRPACPYTALQEQLSVHPAPSSNPLF